MRMNEKCRLPRQVLSWLPDGEQNAGRPAITWKETICRDLEKIGLTWDEASSTAKDRKAWNDLVTAHYASWCTVT